MGEHGRHQPRIGDRGRRHHVAVARRRPERGVLVLDRDDAREQGGRSVARLHPQVAGQLRRHPLRDDAVAVVDLLDQQEPVARLQSRHLRRARPHHHLQRPVRSGGRRQAALLHGDVPLEPLDRVEHAQRRSLARLLARLPDRQPRRLHDDGALLREPAEPLVDARLDGLAHGQRIRRGQLLRLDARADGRLPAQFVAHGELEPEVGHGARVDRGARQQRGGDEHAQREHGEHPPARRAVPQQQPPKHRQSAHDRTRVAPPTP